MTHRYSEMTEWRRRAGIKRVEVNVDKQLWARFRAALVETGSTQKDALIWAIEQFVSTVEASAAEQADH